MNTKARSPTPIGALSATSAPIGLPDEELRAAAGGYGDIYLKIGGVEPDVTEVHAGATKLYAGADIPFVYAHQRVGRSRF